MKANDMQSSIEDLFNPIEVYFSLIKKGKIFSETHNKAGDFYLNIILNENRHVFEELLAQATGILMELNIFLSTPKDIFHEIVMGYYLHKIHYNNEMSLRAWLLHQTSEIYKCNKYRRAV